MAPQRNTRQRQVILDCLKGLGDKHITAEELTELVHEKDPGIGQATVYRYLNRLLEEGMAKKYMLPDGAGFCWQYVDEHSHCHSHCHLKCNYCGEITHLESEFLNELGESLKKSDGFEIDEGDTVIYGKCAKCKTKGNKQ